MFSEEVNQILSISTDNKIKSLLITHETNYEFDAPVFIDPHYLRLRPRETPFNTLESFNLVISPEPVRVDQQYDAENNLVHFGWFERTYKSLNIRAESEVTLVKKNPFNFILFPDGCSDIPFYYSLHLQSLLRASLSGDKIGDSLIAYGRSILAGASCQTLNFITTLTRKIHTDFSRESRLEGDAFGADTTFKLRKGSCRDLSWMQIQLLRHMGIAARFVSGYYYLELEDSLPELHGWLEVYLPGAGWIGFDPSYGIIAGSCHIPICASSHYSNTMPVTGSFRGDASSTLASKLQIRTLGQITT